MERAGDEMSGLAVRARAAGQGVGDLSDSMRDATISARLLSGSLDNVGDNAAQAGRRAAVAAPMFGTLAASAGTAQLAMSALSTVTSTSLIPALALLATTLLPLMGVFGAIAAGAGALGVAFGTIVGTGALAAQQTGALSDAIASAREEIVGLVTEFGKQFIPLLRDAITALPTLVENMLAAVGGTDQFVSVLRQLGQIAMQVLPQLVGAIFQLARIALPIFQDLISFLQSRAGPAFRTVRDAVVRLWPAFVSFSQAVASLLPPLFELGTTVASIVLPALTAIFSAIAGGIQWFNSLASNLQRTAIVATLLAGAITPLISFATQLGVAISTLATQLGPVIVGFLRLATTLAPLLTVLGAVATDFAGIRTQAMRVVNAIAAQLVPTFRALRTTALPIIATFRQQFNAAGGSITKTIRQISRMLATNLVAGIRTAGQVTRTILAQIRTWWATHGQQVTQIVLNLANGIVRAIRSGLQTARTIVRTTVTVIRRVMNNGGQKWIRTIRNTLTLVVSALRAGFSVAVSVTQTILNSLARFWRAHKEEIIIIVSALVSLIGGTIRTLITIIRPILNSLRYMWTNWGDEITAIVNFVADTILAVFGFLIDGLATAITAIDQALNGDLSGAFQTVASFISNTLDGIINYIKTWGSTLVSWIGDALTSVVSTVRSWNLAGAIRSVADSGLTAIQNFASDFYNAGRSLIDSIVSGISSSAGAVQNAVADAVGGARQFLPFSPAKKGPLSDLDKTGPAFVATMATGIRKNTGQLQQASQQAAQAAQPSPTQQPGTRRRQSTPTADALAQAINGSELRLAADTGDETLNQVVELLFSELKGELRTDESRGMRRSVSDTTSI